ncbi:unnamed protein product, partial [Meganyctiphanes norvegica]
SKMVTISVKWRTLFVLLNVLTRECSSNIRNFMFSEVFYYGSNSNNQVNCGESLVGHKGVLSFPTLESGDTTYPNFAHCIWNITVDAGQVIHIVFDYFETEFYFDNLLISDSCNGIGEFNGAQLPDGLTSTGNQMFLTFTSDRSSTRKGFSVYWSGLPDNTEFFN